jgi:hypothetical protein
MDPRLTPEMIKGGDFLFRNLMKAVKATLSMFLPPDFKIILILVNDSEELPGMAILSDYETSSELQTHLTGALQRVTNPTDDLIDTSDHLGARH